MTKSLSKVNLSSLKVLYTLQLLFERNLTMDDLIKYYELYHNEFNSNFVMSKYINTCRYCGIDIKKINSKYTILNFPIGASFTNSELSLFKELKNCCEKIKLDFLSEKMQEILDKINRRIDRSISPVAFSAIKDTKIKTFEKACILQQKIKIIFNDDTSVICEPVDINIGADEINLTIFDGTDTRELKPDAIEVVKILPQKSTSKFIPTTVVFELKDKLARNYQIRENEQVLRINNNGNIVITSRFEDKTKLLHRLMRYGENCTIISPKSYVTEMKNLIDETLKNYI